MELLKDNSDTEYGKKLGFADMRTVDDYRKKVPVQVYDDFAPYIERIMNGEKNILTAYKIDQVNFTSGMVGSKKFVPMTDRQTRVFMKYNHLYLNGLKAELLPEEWMSGKAFCPNEGTCTVNESGITIGCASAKKCRCSQRQFKHAGSNDEGNFHIARRSNSTGERDGYKVSPYAFCIG